MATLIPVVWMAGGAVVAAVVAAAIAGPESGAGIVLGMAGPLIATTTSWMLIARTHRLDPARVMAVMLRAWAAKALFFVAYVVVVVKGLGVAPGPFVISFTVYFIALYSVQARLLMRLFSPAWRDAH